MRKREALAIFSLIIALALTGYVLVSSWAMAQENGEDTTTNEEVDEEDETDDEEEDEEDEEEDDDEEEEEEEEVEEAEEQFGNLFKRLEKMELKVERASMSLIITPQRKATLVNVDLKTIEGDTLTVGVFGLTFTVDASEAKIYGGKEKATVSDLEVGDKLLIKGVVDEETGVIEASRIHDRSVHKKAIENFRAKIQELLRRIEEFQARVGAMQGD